MILSRRAVLGSSAALLGSAIVRAQTFAGSYQPRAELVADGIWLVRGVDEPINFANGGAIANIAIIATDDGPVLFDSGVSLAHGQALAALAFKVTGRPVTRVLISHLHPDHALGAAAFPAQIIHALPATRADLERDAEGFSDTMYRLLSGWMKGTALVLPQGDLGNGPLTIGGRELQLLALNGHSQSDLALLDAATGTLITGDLVFHNRAPATPHADLAHWQAALDHLEAIPHRLLLPGHGPLDRADEAISQTREWLAWVDASLRQSVASGLDMTEAGEVPIPARFAALKFARYELQRSVSHFFPAIETELLPKTAP